MLILQIKECVTVKTFPVILILLTSVHLNVLDLKINSR